jgi:polyvinyl alcohol dehydrogenase (cytochrome)
MIRPKCLACCAVGVPFAATLRSSTLLAVAVAAVACSSKNKAAPPVAATNLPDAAAEAGPPPVSANKLDCSGESPDWPMFGQNVCDTASQQSAGGITPDSVMNLKVKWTYNAAGDISATPAVVGKSVYVADWGGMVSRIDADTGMAVWSKSVGDLVGSSLNSFVSRTAPVVTPDFVIFGTQRDQPGLIKNPGAGAYIIALDPTTGDLKWKQQMETHEAGVITSSPVVDGNRLYVGIGSLEESWPTSHVPTFRGSVAALDVTTGNILWRTYTISDEVYWGPAGPPPGTVTGSAMPAADAGDGGDAAGPPPTAGYAGASVWSSSPAVDRKRHQLYVTTGNNYAAPDGGTSGNGNWVDSVLALDLDTGKIKWGRSVPGGSMDGGMDVFVVGRASGPDSDFGCGANLFSTVINGQPKDLVGAGQKSGIYWAFDPDTGATVWSTQVGPGGPLGGLHWGTSTDGQRVYVEDNNTYGTSFTILGNGPQAGNTSTSGLWAALDTATGDVVWEIEDPALTKPMSGSAADGPTVVVNGVMFAGSMDSMGTMFAFNAATGDTLWSFQSGGTVYGGPAVANGVVYWGCGYPSSRLGFGSSCKKLYAFDLGQ